MLFKKKDKESKPKKEKKVPVMKVGTHKKTVIALWLVLIASVSFGVYKNFTAIDMHTVHEKEVIEQRIVDTNKIENFVKAFAKSYYSWSNTQESIEKRTAAINQYLTKSLHERCFFAQKKVHLILRELQNRLLLLWNVCRMFL